MEENLKCALAWEVDAAMEHDEALIRRLFGSAGLDSSVAAHNVAQAYPHLEGVSLADSASLAEISGVGEQRAQLLQAALAFSRRALHQQTVTHGQVFSSGQLGELLQDRFAGVHQEQMLAYYLDIKNQILCEEVISSGAIEASMADQRVILRRALVLGASKFVICHNHPSGDVHPSSRDEDITERIRMSGHLMGIELMDHIIVGGDDYLSFCEEGLF